MNSQSRNQILSVGGLFVLAILFQNFDFKKNLSPRVFDVDESHRTNHAQELLGSRFEESFAKSLRSTDHLGLAVFNEVYRNLPLDHKDHAVALSRVILQESEKYQMDPIFVIAVIKTESRFNPLARGRHGEIGLMQMKPKTAEWITKKVGKKWLGPQSLENPVVNVKISLAYMNYLRKRFQHDANKYVSAYNMGVTNVNRMYNRGVRPVEYSSRILARYNETYSRISKQNSEFPLIARF